MNAIPIAFPPSPSTADEARACARCRFAFPLPPLSREFQCRRNAPVPILMGVRQNALGKGEPVVNSYFPQVRGEVWCGQFEPALAEGAVAWPVADTSDEAPQ